MKKSLIFITLFLISSLVFIACGNDNNVIKENYIYFLNQEENSLKKVDYHIESENSYEIIMEILNEMSKDSPEGEYNSMITGELEDVEFEISNKILTLYFNNSYYEMEPTREILFRAALVLTMVQLEDVSYVTIYVGEQPLKDSKGSPIGNMSKNDFVDISGELSELEQKITLTLYYPNQNGDMLYSNTFEGRIESNTSYEEIVLSKLSGKAFNSDTQVNSVMTRNDICYVDFSNDFIMEYLKIDDEIAIYSIVNSLCDLPGVSGVKISVDGKSDLKYHEKINLNQIFSSNRDIVE